MKLTIIPVGMIGANCYILSSEAGNCFLIDPGAQPDKIIQYLEDEKLMPKYILFTHGHYDHVGGGKKILAHYEGLAAYIGEGEVPILIDKNRSHAIMKGMGEENFLFDNALVKPVKEGDAFTVDELTITAYETPGHSRAGITYVCERLMFTGDTLFADNVGRTDLDGGDYQTLKRSLHKLCAMEGDFEVFPGHGQSTTLDHERAHNYYINE